MAVDQLLEREFERHVALHREKLARLGQPVEHLPQVLAGQAGEVKLRHRAVDGAGDQQLFGGRSRRVGHARGAAASGQAKKPDELNGIVVATVNNAPVTVADDAKVSGGVEPQYTMVTAAGKPAALVNINRQPDANTVAVVDEVRATLATLKGQIPSDVHVAAYYDQSLLVRESIKSVRDAILIGLLLSVAILYGFLRNWGTTLVAILVIPVTVLATFVAMWLAGLSFDPASGVLFAASPMWMRGSASARTGRRSSGNGAYAWHRRCGVLAKARVPTS